MTIQDRLNALREARAGTWASLAADLGISRTMLHYVRQGRRSLGARVMMRVADLESASGVKRHVVDIFIPRTESRDKLLTAINRAAREIEAASPSVRWMLSMAIQEWAARLTKLLRAEARATLPSLELPPIAEVQARVDNLTETRYDSGAAMESSDAAMKKLIEDVKRLTNARGSRAALARALGVRPQRLNEWLSGKHVPRGEISLLLRDWVRAEEPQKEGSEGAETPSKPKTRQRKSTEK